MTHTFKETLIGEALMGEGPEIAHIDRKIYEYNYQATKLAIERAVAKEPAVGAALARKDSAKHPFA